MIIATLVVGGVTVNTPNSGFQLHRSFWLQFINSTNADNLDGMEYHILYSSEGSERVVV